MFTLKQLFPSVSQEVRFSFGKHIAQSFKTRFKKEPDKIDEDGFVVCIYPDTFQRQARIIYGRWKKRQPLKRRRKRITATEKVRVNG